MTFKTVVIQPLQRFEFLKFAHMQQVSFFCSKNAMRSLAEFHLDSAPLRK